MHRLADNIPGVPFRWAREVRWWATGGLVQYRYTMPKEHWLTVKPEEQGWRDCDYCTRGMPNWFNSEFEFRIHPDERDSMLCLEGMTKEQLDAYEYGSEGALVAITELLDDKHRGGKSQKEWQAVRERVWRLLDNQK